MCIIDQLNVGLRKVREILGNEVATDKEIQESLWYYFFDVEKTVNYILSNASATYH
jgi:elongation factor 1 alpha-like protein